MAAIAPALNPPLCAPPEDTRGTVPARLFAADGKPIVCWENPGVGCVEIDSTVAPVAHPPAASSLIPELRTRATHLEACLGLRCKTLGPKLVAAIAAARAANAALPDYLRDGTLTIRVTTDLSMVWILDDSGTASQADSLWSIGRDTSITPRTPPSLRALEPYQALGYTEMVGSTVIVGWSWEAKGLPRGAQECEGGCVVRTVVDEFGHTHGALPKGEAFDYDNLRFVTLDEYDTVSVVAARSGEVLGKLLIEDGLGQPAFVKSGFVKLGEGKIAVLLFRGNESLMLVRLGIAGNKPKEVSRYVFESCTQ